MRPVGSKWAHRKRQMDIEKLCTLRKLVRRQHGWARELVRWNRKAQEPAVK